VLYNAAVRRPNRVAREIKIMTSKWIRGVGAATVAAVLTLALGCGVDSGAAPADEPKPMAEAPKEEAKPAEAPKEEAKPAMAANEQGKQLFTTYCVACHGAAGLGDGVAGAALNPKPASFADPAFWSEPNRVGDARTDDHIKKVIKEGGASVGLSPLMAPWGAVVDTDEKLDAIVAYVKSFKP
jgi:mono/diheme cytochrome c family protein